ncbi:MULTISPECIES: GNAT family N-acetyltransferase [unclassified Kitasatospora]|uniref:GNAT family N-acetyltransferase n=1 Tax=unclassified Kitasatospora TaxID=2633591 RepID=UPI00381D1BBA
MFTTNRLTIRQWQPEDRERALDIYSRWEVTQWLGRDPRTLENLTDAEATIERFRSRSADPRFGIWAAERKDTGVVAGSVLLAPIPDGDGEVEVGWHLHPDSWGQGYATEAAQGVVAKGFADGLAEIHSVVRPDNRPSLAVCHRLGMTALGRTTRWYGMELEEFRLTP